jgi:hypothetical protein
MSSLPILATLMMEAIRSSKTSALTRTTRRHIPEDGILLQPVAFLLTKHALPHAGKKLITPLVISLQRNQEISDQRLELAYSLLP